MCHVLTPDEAEFLDAAMSRFFPGGIRDPSGSGHVDCKLQRLLCPDDGEAPSEVRAVSAALYRVTIGVVQSYCLRVHDRRFQALSTREQDAVLAQLEEGTHELHILFEMILDDATEAFLTQALWSVLEQAVPAGSASRPSTSKGGRADAAQSSIAPGGGLLPSGRQATTWRSLHQPMD